MPVLWLSDTSKGKASNRKACEGSITEPLDSVLTTDKTKIVSSRKTLGRETLLQQIKDRHKLLSETARRRGFFWGSFEIYGGLSGFLDLGPLGVGLKRQIEDTWRQFFLQQHGFVEVST